MALSQDLCSFNENRIKRSNFIKLSNFGRNVQTKVRENERKSPKVQQFCSIYRDIQDIGIRDIKSFFA